MDIKIGSQWKFKKEYLGKWNTEKRSAVVYTVLNVVDNKVFYRWVGISVDSDGILMNADINLFLKELELYLDKVGILSNKIEKIKAALKV